MASPPTNTSLYKLNHTMLRIKDPKVSVKFYEENFGMKVIKRLDFAESNFSLYFLAFDSPKAENAGKHWTDRESVLELTHNYGTENDPNFKINNGNVEPYRGFGYICFTVDNIKEACARLERNNVAWHKKLADNSVAFVLDPDGYWIEIMPQKMPSARLDDTLTTELNTTDIETYRFNSTMIRVKDPDASLSFYRDILGMSLLYTLVMNKHNFNGYFVGYPHETDNTDESALLRREGMLNLTWNFGTELDPKFSYHNGNTDPKGFGHICISVDDIQACCARLEAHKVNFKKRLSDGSMKTIAFVLDPDNYWVEIVQNETLKKHAGW